MTKNISKLGELFVDEYKNQLKLSDTQKQLFEIIAQKKYKRVGVITPTQYGKSLIIALGTICRAATFPEKWTIIAPTKSKTGIIMGYIIDHIFDSELFSSQLDVEGGRLEQLRRERNREHLTFKRGGEIMILTADARNKKKLGDALLGFGSENIIIDESPLIDDSIYAYVKRMVGGKVDNFILETGNPVKRNHFYKAMTKNKKYHKIWIDYKEALKENRFTQDFIDEMREEKFFDIFYECKFPDEDAIDIEGYQNLFQWSLLEKCGIDKDKITIDNTNAILGADIGKGRDENAFILRDNSCAKISKYYKEPDLSKTSTHLKELIKQEGLFSRNVFVDEIGIGSGVSALLRKDDVYIIPATVSERADDPITFSNKRAECYWRMYEWLAKGGQIENHDELLQQLSEIRYKIDSGNRIQIEPKEKMRLRGIDSPNLADALSLTFYRQYIADDKTRLNLLHNAITGYKEIHKEADDLRERFGIYPKEVKGQV